MFAVPTLTCTMTRRDFARHHRITVRHADREIFVRREDRLRNGHTLLRCLGISFDNRREIGPAITEEKADAPLSEKREICARNRLHRVLLRLSAAQDVHHRLGCRAIPVNLREVERAGACAWTPDQPAELLS